MRASVGCLMCDGRVLGTAWWISDRHLLTAYHCVENHEEADTLEVFFQPEGYSRPFPVEVRVLPRPSDPSLDVAVLELKTGVRDPSLRSLPLAPFGALSNAIERLKWEGYGFPEAHLTGLYAWGIAERRVVPAGTRSEVQLTCEQGGTDGLAGLSGGPVMVRGRVVALIRNGPELLKQKVILAPCMESVAEVYPELVGPLVPRLPMALAPSAEPPTWYLLDRIRKLAPTEKHLHDFVSWLLPHWNMAPVRSTPWAALRVDVVHAAYQGQRLRDLDARLDVYERDGWQHRW